MTSVSGLMLIEAAFAALQFPRGTPLMALAWREAPFAGHTPPAHSSKG
jgi:hypothetical protein